MPPSAHWSSNDASMDAELNGVLLAGASTALVPWAKAFPRPEWDRPEHWLAARPEAAK